MAVSNSQEIVLNIAASPEVNTPSSQKKTSWFTYLAQFSTVSSKDILLFFELLKTLSTAGLPINQSLEILENQTKNPKLKAVCGTVRSDVKNGMSFSKALKSHQKLFDKSIIAVIQAGEKSGKFNQVLAQLTLQLQRAQDIKNQAKSIMTYPIIVITVMIILSVILLVFVIPQLSSIFNGVENLPMATRLMIYTSDMVLQQWPLMLSLISVLGLSLYFFSKTHIGSRWVDWLSISMPIISRINRKIILSKTTRLFGLLLNAGIPIVESLKLCSDIAGNVFYKEKLLLAAEDIGKGIPLAENLSDNEKLFPPILVQMIAVGEKTASLDNISERIAGIYDDEIGREIKTLSQLMEPFILAVIAGAAIFMILAIYMPIMEMNNHLM